MGVLAQSSEQSPSSPCWVPSERIQKLAAEHNRAVPAVGAERAIHYTDFYKNEAQRYSTAHQINAHSLAYHLRHRTVRVYDDELLVGTHTEHRIGAICQIEKTGTVMLEDLFRFEKRAVNPLAIDPKVRWTLLRSVIPYWLNRNLVMRSFPWFRRVRFAKEQLSGTWFTVNEAGGIAHFLPDYESVIQLGTEGLRERVIARQTQGSLNEAHRGIFSMRAWWRSVQSSCLPTGIGWKPNTRGRLIWLLCWRIVLANRPTVSTKRFRPFGFFSCSFRWSRWTRASVSGAWINTSTRST